MHELAGAGHLPHDLIERLHGRSSGTITAAEARALAETTSSLGGEMDDDDRAGLQRLERFLRESGGFAIRPTPGLSGPVAAAPAAPAQAPTEGAPQPPPAATDATAGRIRKSIGPIAIAGFFVIKFAAKGKALLLLATKVKFLGTALSAVASIGAYALFWGWRFAALFVGLLFIHELGHWAWMKVEKIPTSAIIFIPFLGAVIGMKEMPKNAWVEAKVGLAGPILGSAGAAVLWVIGEQQGSQLMIAAAHTGFFLNLFNLAPITPLDGGRAAAALHPLVWLLGIFAIALFFFYMPNIILLLILVLGGMDAYRRLRAWRNGDPESRRYYEVKPYQRVIVAVVYFGLAALLALAMTQTLVPRPG